MMKAYRVWVTFRNGPQAMASAAYERESRANTIRDDQSKRHPDRASDGVLWMSFEVRPEMLPWTYTPSWGGTFECNSIVLGDDDHWTLVTRPTPESVSV